MFAVVEINDKQHLVQEGDVFTIDGIIEDEKATFTSILMIQNGSDIQYGEPYIDDITVHADVLESGKREKDIVFKFKRKTGYKLTRGHRQKSTLLKITNINIKSNEKKASKSTKVATDPEMSKQKKASAKK
ncbi:MAG: 50S ribosomal protein L21 [Candidatus Marinamargulisbacteria bacterium]